MRARWRQDGSGIAPAGIFAVDACLFRTLATQNFRVDKTFTANTTMIDFLRRFIARRAGHGAPRRSFMFTVTALIISLITGGATSTVSARLCWAASPFPVRGLWVRLSESSSLRTYITLTLPLLFLIHRSCFSPPALREARRLPDVHPVSHDFV